MATYYEALLPNGRAVRYADVDTATYLDCEERAAAAVGTRPDPGNARLNRARSLELVCASLRFVTAPLPIALDADPDEALAAVPDTAWTPVNPLALVTEDGPLCWKKLFAAPADFLLMVSLVNRTMEPARPIDMTLGKARRVSV